MTVSIESVLDTKGRDVATVPGDLSLLDAAAILRDRGIGALVVSEDGARIDGIVSERDVVRAIASHGAGVLGLPVSSVMTTSVVTCRAHDSVDELMSLMTTRRVRHIPVVGAEGELAGIVSIGDVVKQRVGQLESENQTLFDYINAR
jgi:CBS domain-containing protein